MEESQQSHFSEPEWVDYVRNLVSGEKSQTMRGHLDSGCGTCAQTVGWLRDLMLLGRSDPPEPLVGQLEAAARAVFRPGGSAASTLSVSSHGATVRLEVRVGGALEVLGRISRESGGAPLEGIRVELITSSGDVRETRSDPDGRFGFADLPHGRDTTLRILLEDGPGEWLIPVDAALRQGA